MYENNESLKHGMKRVVEDRGREDTDHPASTLTQTSLLLNLLSHSPCLLSTGSAMDLILLSQKHNH